MHTTRAKLQDWVITVIAVIIGLILIFPIIYTIAGAFKEQSELFANPAKLLPESFLYFNNFKEVLRMTPMFRFMLNSFIVATLGTSLRILFAILAAYSFTYFQFKGDKILFFIILATMMLPAETLLITNYLTVSGMGLLNTYFGMCITSLVGGSQMFMLRQAFKSIPTEFKEAASMDGCGDMKYLWNVVVPVTRPVIMILIVQSFIGLWNAYVWPLLITNHEQMRTVQVGITMLYSDVARNYHLVMAGMTLLFIPSLILFIILRRNIVKGIMSGSLVG